MSEKAAHRYIQRVSRVLVISDVHGNLEGLEEALDWGLAEGCDEVWNLGDTLGIGSEGIACYDRLQSASAMSLLGNHDYCAINPREIYRLAAAAPAMVTQMQRITAEDRLDVLFGIGAWHRAVEMNLGGESLLAFHATPGSLWEFMGKSELQLTFARTKQRFLFAGHTHRRYLATLSAEGKLELATQSKKVLLQGVEFEPGKRYLINPGAVGGLGKDINAAGILTLAEDDERPLRFDWKLS